MANNTYPTIKFGVEVIKNVTAQKHRRVDMVFGIGYADDIPHAERVLHEIVEGHEKVLEDPEPVVRLHTLNESSVDFVVRPWCDAEDYWTVWFDVTQAILRVVGVNPARFRVHLSRGRRHPGKGSQQQKRNPSPDQIYRMFHPRLSLIRKSGSIS